MTQFQRPSKAAQAGAALAAIALLAGGLGASAQPAGRRAPALQSLLDCRALTDGAQRLACYDKATEGLGQAEAKGEVVVVDREQVRQANRSAFGFSFRMPDVFGGGDKESSADLDNITATVARAYRGGDGKWTVELEDGAIWRQVDTEPVRRAPKAGSKAEIRKASMGSFFMNLDGQRAVRAQRMNR